MQKTQQFLIIIDLSILALLVLFIIGFFAYDYEVLGIKEPLIRMPSWFKTYYDFLPWVLFSLLVIDLILKYKLTEGNLRYFLRKYWFDILLTILIPVLFPLKFIKPTLKIYKSTKFAKSGYKLLQKYDKLFKFNK